MIWGLRLDANNTMMIEVTRTIREKAMEAAPGAGGVQDLTHA